MTTYKDELYHHGIKDQKWGVRRYRNKDGSLTEAGKKRYARDVRDNLARKKENRIDTSNPDPDRWVREDITRSKKVVDSTAEINKQLQNIVRNSPDKSRKQKLDTSNMSDKELRDKINRALLERQYNDLYAPESESKIRSGKEAAMSTLEAAGKVLAVGSSALAIALAIKELKG